MSKASAIRKKALDLVRNQNWEAAIREYHKLADADQTNPNVYNELGDIYLKTGNKTEAYDSFVKAIDAYARVSLYNNAVAVCKKVLRLIPSRIEVLTKLGSVRMRQGLTKEAEGYYASYLDNLDLEAAVNVEELTATVDGIVSEMADFPELVDKVVECLLKHNVKERAGEILIDQHQRLTAKGDAERAAGVRARIEELGMLDELEQRAESAPPAGGDVITEDNIWTAEHSDGDRIEIDVSSQAARASGNEESAATTPPTAVMDYGSIELESGPAPAGDKPSVADESQATLPGDLLPEDTPPPGKEETSDEGQVKVSAIADRASDEVADKVGAEDYRSHYDLGMAYLEMDLLAESIREFQFAAKSPQFQIKSLEMIGLCFLRQNQPELAIKQLVKGLEMVPANAVEALGIKYNLGLAWEMSGDMEQARALFEDVYAVDVTFREVAEKIKRLSGLD